MWATTSTGPQWTLRSRSFALARGGEVRVSDLAAQIGMTQQAVSNQLQRLVDQRIVATRRDGNNIYYRIVDACVPALLELGWCLLDTIRARY